MKKSNLSGRGIYFALSTRYVLKNFLDINSDFLNWTVFYKANGKTSQSWK